MKAVRNLGILTDYILDHRNVRASSLLRAIHFIHLRIHIYIYRHNGPPARSETSTSVLVILQYFFIWHHQKLWLLINNTGQAFFRSVGSERRVLMGIKPPPRLQCSASIWSIPSVAHADRVVSQSVTFTCPPKVLYGHHLFFGLLAVMPRVSF